MTQLEYLLKLRNMAKKDPKYYSICRKCKFGYSEKLNESYTEYKGRKFYNAYMTYKCMNPNKLSSFEFNVQACIYFIPRGN